jgi:hypothetical protein
MENDILSALKTLQPRRASLPRRRKFKQPEQAGIFPEDLTLFAGLHYDPRHVRRKMNDLVSCGVLVRVGYQQGYLLAS